MKRCFHWCTVAGRQNRRYYYCLVKRAKSKHAGESNTTCFYTWYLGQAAIRSSKLKENIKQQRTKTRSDERSFGGGCRCLKSIFRFDPKLMNEYFLFERARARALIAFDIFDFENGVNYAKNRAIEMNEKGQIAISGEFAFKFVSIRFGQDSLRQTKRHRLPYTYAPVHSE